MITVASMFRDSTVYLDRYFAQVAALRAQSDVRLVVAEGDSADDTLDGLKDRLSTTDTLIKVDHGGPVYGSVDVAARWADIATVVRGVVDAVGDPPAMFVWVESDLVWQPETILALVADAAEVGAVAPMVYCADGERFYDTWGFRRDGERFTASPPYYFCDEPGLVKIDSCGSCFVTADWASVQAWDGRWPFTAGGNLWLDPTVGVRHP